MGLLCPNNVVVVLQQHPRVFQFFPQVGTKNPDLIRAPTPSILVYSRGQSLKVVQELNEIESADFFELFVFGPGADGEGEGTCFNIGETGFADPVFDLRTTKRSEGRR